MDTKICSKCKNLKEVSFFYKQKRNKDGLYSSCKECCKYIDKEKYKKNIVLYKEINKDYRCKNSEKIKEIKKIYYKKTNKHKEIQSKHRKELYSWYLRILLKQRGFSKEDIKSNPMIIELQRAILINKRLTKNNKNE